MIRFMLLLLLAGMPPAASAGVYKWTDTNGQVFYGDTPPASVQAYFPELRVPSGVDMLGCAPGECVSPGPRQQVVAEAAVSRHQVTRSRGMPFGVYIRLQRGMTEGELLLRAGPPDHEFREGLDATQLSIVQRGVLIDPATGRNVPQRIVTHSQSMQVVKTYYYFPTSSDPWITVVTLVGGRIANMDRQKRF
ncbi:MAG TPA: DUF4124 domain-containing protein [Burkholderiales bacterium]|nr:DUF4124 domain-containing protein [Burkholderiales bacterium]